MTIGMYAASVPVFQQMLKSLDVLLDKAAAHCADRKIEPAVLVGYRLAPDMFTLARQVQLASDFAKGTVARLAGREMPKFEDTEQTIPELKARIAKTLDFIASVPAGEIDGSESRTITISVRGEPRSFEGQSYLLHWGLPHFFFHVTTAYAVLRHCGVAVGKPDYMGSR